MIKYLETCLYDKTKDSQSEILFAQWNYDKKIIPSALQAVSTLFPHYSLHDESHSVTIVNNIVRIIGKENIPKLSAIDIWMILEASYSHDIGMVVSSKELINSIKKNDFLDFFKDLIQDPKNGLFEFANQFKIVDNEIKYTKDTLNLELHDGIKFILAEYFRRSHSDRSKDIITNPHLELALSSPRGVIPQRIFKILADVCACHTKDFSEVMKLPFSEVGIDIEDAHPRYIACLLRIGDLLDLDNNRFSEVMLRTLTKIPVDTLNHKSKHLSIESFRVDRERIEVLAKCHDYDTATITQHWFNYLNSEISMQMINWNNIVPTKELGYLPTIGNLKVELSDFDYIDGKNKPKFSVDTDKALELLKGAGLYDGAYQSIREILQNAVDATLTRIWLEYSHTKDFSTPQSSDFIHLANDFPISFNIIEKNIEDDIKNWTIEIIDNGTGISNNDLRFLMNTGSSFKNREKMNIVESMPIWMKPSGTFGIGFQSVFMLTEIVTIETKSYLNEEFQIIQLNSPDSKRDGEILIKREKTNHSKKPGTKISINFKAEAIPSRYSVGAAQKNANRIVSNFDPFSNDSLDIEVGKILDEIFDFNNKCYIPINLFLNGKQIKTKPKNRLQFEFFNSEHSFEFSIVNKLGRNPRLKVFYKNQPAELNSTLKFLAFDINLHNDKASKVLTLNRNKVKSEYVKNLQSQFFQSVSREIRENFNAIFKEDNEKVFGSMFVNFYAEELNIKLDLQKFNHWEKLKIRVNNSDFLELGLLFKNAKKIIIRRPNNRSNFVEDIYSFTEDIFIVEIQVSKSDITSFLIHKAQETFNSVTFSKSQNGQNYDVAFSRDHNLYAVDKLELLSIFNQIRGGYYSSRTIIPCVAEYPNLRIKPNSFKPYVFKYQYFHDVKFEYPEMLSPFVAVITAENLRELQLVLNEEVYNWTYENRFEEKTTLEEIKQSYTKFAEEFNIDDLNKEKMSEDQE